MGMSFQGAGVRLPIWSIIISFIWCHSKPLELDKEIEPRIRNLMSPKLMIFNMFKGEEIWQNLSGSNLISHFFSQLITKNRITLICFGKSLSAWSACELHELLLS